MNTMNVNDIRNAVKGSTVCLKWDAQVAEKRLFVQFQSGQIMEISVRNGQNMTVLENQGGCILVSWYAISTSVHLAGYVSATIPVDNLALISLPKRA